MIYKTVQKDHKINRKYPDKVQIDGTQLKYTFEIKKERFIKVFKGQRIFSVWRYSFKAPLSVIMKYQPNPLSYEFFLL